jgi:LysR family transcriptional regulator, pca operon transcriptional activator
MHPAIKLRHIRLFLTVADLGGLTAAGRTLGLSQPAMSKSLSELETLLGAPLLTRAGRRITLTPAGEVFRRQAQAALSGLEAAAHALRADPCATRLSIGLLPTVSTRFFPAIAAALLAEGPAPTLSIETGAHPVLLRKLRDRQIDLMIGRMPQTAEMPGLTFEFLYEEPIIAAVRAGHPGARTPLPALLRQVPLILPPRDAIIRATVDAYLAALGLADLTPAVETATLALGRGLLTATDAIWFISQGVLADELGSGRVTALPLGATYLSGAVGMTVAQGHPLPPALHRLMALARSAAATQRAGAEPGGLI